MLKKRNYLNLVFCILFLLVNPPSSISKIFYVSKSGNDHNPGTSEKPFYSIQKSVDSLRYNGDEILISPGDYYESVLVNNSKKIIDVIIKSTNTRVNIIPDDKKPALTLKYAINWRIEGINFCGNNARDIVLIYRSPGSIIENCMVSGGSSSSIAFRSVYVLSSPNFVISNSTIDAFSENNIMAFMSENLLIKGNDFSNSSAITIGFDAGCNYTVCEENYIHDRLLPGIKERVIIQCRENTGSIIRRNLIVERQDNSFLDAILIRGPGNPSKNVLVENNTLIGPSSQTAIGIAANTLSSVCRNNIVVGFRNAIKVKFPVTQLAKPEVKVDYNDFYNITGSVYDDNVGLCKIGNTNISSDPNFSDMLHYKLNPGSPCIDSGDPLSPLLPGGGKRIDIGRHEYYQQM